MLEDSPTVPTLLTDYILKHICPSDSYQTGADTHNQTTYVRSALRSLARGHQSLPGPPNTQTLSQLTATLNSKFKAARKSLSFSNNKNGISCSQHNNNNNPETSGTSSRKSSISGPASTLFDNFNVIVAWKCSKVEPNWTMGVKVKEHRLANDRDRCQNTDFLWRGTTQMSPHKNGNARIKTIQDQHPSRSFVSLSFNTFSVCFHYPPPHSNCVKLFYRFLCCFSLLLCPFPKVKIGTLLSNPPTQYEGGPPTSQAHVVCNKL